MDEYEMIRTAHRGYGKSISELSRLTGHSRNTVKKAIRGEPWGYKERSNQAFPALAPHLETIDGWIEGDKSRPKKQRHTGRRVFNRLVEEYGFKGAESTVRRYVRLTKARLGLNGPGAFVPCDPQAGYEGEVDWGTALAVIADQQIRLKFFCIRSKYSGKHFVRFYFCERQQAFFDAHVHGFIFFGGVFPVLIYDNLTTAVQKVLIGRQRKEQEEFIKFKAYHSFQARFCNPGEGHEKGGVEGLVGFARRNYMVPIPEAASIEQLNERILQRCITYGSHKMAGREKTVEGLYEEEKRHLVALPDSVFGNVQTCDGRVDKYATVIVDINRYSVPSRYAGMKAKVLLYVDRVELFVAGKKVATHRRLYGKSKWSLNPDHYLELIQQRPMSFHSARPIRQWRQMWPDELHRLLERFKDTQGETRGIKDFISVLMLYREYPASDIEAAVGVGLENRISSSEGIRHILISKVQRDEVVAPLADWPSLPPPDVQVYGQLGGVI
jgi:transposase